jgi:hypothetical protein
MIELVLGLLGLSGGAVAAVLALAPFVPFLKPAAVLIRAVLSTVWAFIRQPPGSYIALIGAVVLAWWWSGSIGYDRGKGDCKAAQIVIHDKQIVYVKAAGAVSEARTGGHAVENKHNKQEVNHVAQDAAARADAGDECIRADLADRLRGLH